MITNPIERLNIYSEPTPTGGIRIDVYAMLHDIIAVAKLSGQSLIGLCETIEHEWDNVEAVAYIPDKAKN